MNTSFKDQFTVKKSYYLESLDFLNWFRYFHLIKDVLDSKVDSILEVGSGSGLVKNCLKPLVKNYKVIDVNPELEPEILSDIRDVQAELVGGFDCVIAADVLEHLPFADLEIACFNIYSYLKPGGLALITIPHRQSNFLFMSPRQVPKVFTVPTGFLSFGAFYRRFLLRKIWIDPNHCWEIGDGKIKKKDVEACFLACQFRVSKFEKLLYVDYWVLERPFN